MAGSPKKRALLAALQSRAIRECGEGSTIVDFATQFFAKGHNMQDLADLLAVDGLKVSRSFLSWTLNHSPDAAARLDAARREARAAELEERLNELRTESEAQRRNPASVTRRKDEPPTCIPAA